MQAPTLTLNLKQSLYQKCMEIVEDKIIHEVGLIDSAQQASNLETKSSAGDKYETTRAMMQIEKEKHGFQLKENRRIKNILSQVNVGQAYTSIQAGSLIYTNFGAYFLSIGLGEIDLEGVIVMTLSPASPLGKALLHKKTGESFDFRSKTWKILALI